MPINLKMNSLHFIVMILVLVCSSGCGIHSDIEQQVGKSVLISHPSQQIQVISIDRPVPNEIVLCIENTSDAVQVLAPWPVKLPQGDGSVVVPKTTLARGEKRFFKYKQK
jgi:hypothetical protein